MSAQGKESGSKIVNHKSKMSFYNKDGEEVGVLDFSGEHLSFEGNADQSAIVLMENTSTVFQYRLMLEYNKGYKAGKDFTQNKTSG
jgi:hypothetical protein